MLLAIALHGLSDSGYSGAVDGCDILHMGFLVLMAINLLVSSINLF